MISYAQNLEDVVLNRLFQNKKSGFYIDVGACDPVEMSVTKHFYDLGWSGINIEPVHSGYKRFLKERPRDINLNLAVGLKHDFQNIFEVEKHPEYSSLDQKIAKAAASHTNSSVRPVKIEVQTLAAICYEYCGCEIDFLKIDAEGMENEVIKGADWKAFRPAILVIEASLPCSSYDYSDPMENASWQEWEPTLIKADYIPVYDDTLNRYYLRKENEYLKSRFSSPVNPVRDDFVLYTHVSEMKSLKQENRVLATGLEELAEEKEGLELSLSSMKNSLKVTNEQNAILQNDLLRITCERDYLEKAVLKKGNELDERRIEIEKIIKDRDFLRCDLKKEILERDTRLTNLKQKETEYELLNQEAEQLRRARNRQASELKHLRTLAEKSKQLQSEISLLRHLLVEQRFRREHRIRCFIERFIPFLRLPAASVFSSSKNEFSRKEGDLGSLGGKWDSGFLKANQGETSSEAHPYRPVLSSPSGSAIASFSAGIDVEMITDYSCFGITARHWSAAMEVLRKNNCKNGLFFTPCASSTIFRNPDNPQPIKRPWIGIIQEPHTIPQWLASLPGCGGAHRLFAQKSWQESLPYCQGLFALSKYSAEFLRKRFPEKNVSVIYHPADFSGDLWSPEKFENNSEKKVIQPGWYLRNLHSIYELPETKAHRVAVPCCGDWSLYDQIFKTEHAERKSKGLLFESMMKTASVLENETPADLGIMLTENIAFVNLYESNTVDAVIECLARATPLLVNAMPAVVEYLGPGYPYYMWCYDQAAEKVDDHELALKTHEYLMGLDIRKQMAPEAFRDSILKSEVYTCALETAEG